MKLNNLYKFTTVAALTGLGYILSLIMIPIMTRVLPAEVIANIGVIENILTLFVSLTTFGIQMSLSREIIFSNQWEAILQKGRGERLGISLLLSLLLIIMSLCYNFKNEEIILFCAIALPLIALNPDFALYVKSKPIHAAFASLIRQSFPVGVFIVVILSENISNAEYLYIFLISFFLMLSGYVASKLLGINYFVSANLNFIKKLKEYFLIGIPAVLLSVLRSSPILLANISFNKIEVLGIYGVMKIYLIYIGLRRLLLQTFFKEILSGESKKKIELLLVSISLACLILTICFRNEIALIIYGNSIFEDAQVYISILGLLFIGASLYFTSGTLLVQEKNDGAYMKNHIAASVFYCALCSIGYILKMPAYSLLIFLAVAEIFLSIMHKVSIRKEHVLNS